MTPRPLGAAKADPDRDWLFGLDGRDFPSRWNGADAAYSVSVGLSSVRTIWFFGDTLLDRWTDHAKMVRNSVGFQRGDVKFFWGPGDTDFFPPRRKATWLWPGAAFETADGFGVFLHEFAKKGEGIFGFARTGCWIARVGNPLEGPSAWRVTYEERPFHGEQLYYGIAALRRGTTLYVYGAVEELPRRWLVVARVIEGRWEYLNEDGWGPAPTKPRRLCDGIGAELSVTPGRDGQVQLVTTENGLSTKIHLREAEAPEGPFGEPRVIFTCPEPTWDKDYFTYAAKAHSQFVNERDRLVVTYCANSMDFGKLFKDPRIYRPRFVVVK